MHQAKNMEKEKSAMLIRMSSRALLWMESAPAPRSTIKMEITMMDR